MITSMTRLPGSDLCEFRTFAFAFPSNGNRSKTRPYQFGMAATRPLPPAPVQNGKPLFSATPRGDHLGDDNQPAFASLHSIANAAQCTDFGFAQDVAASLAPDTKLRGIPVWKVGDNASNAAAKLAKIWSAHQAKNQPKQPSVGNRL
jgi:hypothetical protein